MPGIVAALGLLLLNVAIIGGVLVFSPTPRRAGKAPTATDACFVCSTTDLETTVNGYPVCDSCNSEYF